MDKNAKIDAVSLEVSCRVLNGQDLDQATSDLKHLYSINQGELDDIAKRIHDDNVKTFSRNEE